MLRIGPVGESSDTMESILHVGVYEISIRLKGGDQEKRWMGVLDYIREDVRETAAGHVVLRNEMYELLISEEEYTKGQGEAV